jgi:uncharacterized damage-inducible protein DinB
MAHFLVTQLRFARSEFERCLEDVSAADALVRVGQMNCISWIVGHLANQEHNLWVRYAQGKTLFPVLNDLVGSGKPASTPDLDEMWQTWKAVTALADEYLDDLTIDQLQTRLMREGQPMPETVGTTLLRNIYHYWFHTGEAHAIRQVLGHKDLPQFVGNLSTAVYRPED